MRRLAALVPITLLLAACGSADAGPASDGSNASTAAARGGLTLRQVGGSFDAPLYVTAAPGDSRRLFVVEQGGTVRVVKGGRTASQPFLDLRSRITSGGEQGLLSIAFAPDYARSGLLYAYYTGKDERQHVVELRRGSSPDRIDPSSARAVLTMDDPEPNHNGGLMLFGPDRLLYIGTGDGGGGGDQHGARGNAQDRGSLLGKILRIDPRATGGRPYAIPASNPFASGGGRGEIYAYGLRNPWRFSFDRRTGDLAIGDVGQDQVEEVDFVRRGQGRGANFGWRVFEGGRRYTPGESAPGALAPSITHTHSSGWCSVTGGIVVRDPALASLTGRYVYADYCQGELRVAKLRPGGASGDRELGLEKVEGLTSFGQDNAGHVYVVSGAGRVFRLTPG